jgi:DNA mismatch repair protein MLH1
MPHLPDFLLSLAYDVDWAREKQCFASLAQVLASFYAELPPPLPPADAARADAAAAAAHELAHRKDPASAYFALEATLFPALRKGLAPPAKLAAHHHVVQLACTEQLYRVFERC